MKKFKILFSLLFAISVLFIGIDAKATGETTLVTGAQFNSKIRELAGCDTEVHSGFGGSVESCSNITNITRASEMPSNVETILISTTEDDYAAYAWFNNGTIYWYSLADFVYMNSDSSLMFTYLTGIVNLDLRDFDTSKVTNMQEMFACCFALKSINLSNFNTSNVTNMMAMFLSCTQLQSIDLSSFDTRKVTNFTYLFDSCYSLKTIDLSSFDTRAATSKDMSNMFYYNENLETIYVTKLFTLNTGSTIFTNDLKIVGGQGTTVPDECEHDDICQVAHAHIDGGTENPGYFTETPVYDVNFYDENLVLLVDYALPGRTVNKPSDPVKAGYEFKGWYTDKNYTTTFNFNNAINSNTNVYAKFEAKEATFDDGQRVNMKMKLIAGNDVNLDTTEARFDDTNVKKIVRATALPEDISGFTVNNNIAAADSAPIFIWFDSETGTLYWHAEKEKVYMHQHAGYMLARFKNVESIDLTGIDTSKSEELAVMFMDDEKLKEVDLSTWNTSKSWILASMFANCKSLKTIDISNFSDAVLISTYAMFDGASSLETVNFGEMTLSGVTDMRQMFRGCSSLKKLDVSNWTAVPDQIDLMFNGCTNLKRIYASGSFDLNNADPLYGTTSTIFTGDTNLVGGAGTTYSSNHTNYEYGRLDTSNTPGYFTKNDYVTVTFLVDNETFKTVSVLIHDSLTESDVSKPTKEDYSFINWYLDENFETPLNVKTTTFSENTNIYAKFVPNPTLTVDMLEGSGTVTIVDDKGNDITEKGSAPLYTPITITVFPNENFIYEKTVTKSKETGNIFDEFTTTSFGYGAFADIIINPILREKPVVTIENNDTAGTITVEKTAGGAVVNGDHVEENTEVTVNVEAKENYKFIELVVTNPDGSETRVTEFPYNYTVSGNVTFTTVFKELPVINIGGGSGDDSGATVDVTGPNGSIGNGDHVPEGTQITIGTNPNNPNNQVTGVEIVDPTTGNVIGTLTEEPYTYVVNGPIVINPIIKEKPVVTIPEDPNVTVTITGPDGPINPGDHLPIGTEITIGVEPNPGIVITGVEIVDPKTGEVITTLTEEPYTYVVNDPIEIRPTYNVLPKITTPDGDPNGTVNVTKPNGDPVGGYVEPGTTVTIDVTPTNGKEVDKVIITNPDGTKTVIPGDQLPYNYIVTGPIEIEVVYRDKPTINLPENSEEEKGIVKVTDSNGKELKNGDYVGTGEEITIDVTPKDGYKVDKVLIKDKDGNVIEVIPGTELPKKILVNGPIVIEPVYVADYKIIDGDGQTYIKGSNEDIVIKCNGALEEFNGIEIDNGNPVDPSNYEVESGSTILTLKSSFLEASSVGEHTITFNYKDGGSAEAKLTVAEEVVVPTTGDNIILYVIICVVSLIILTASVICLRKKTK